MTIADTLKQIGQGVLDVAGQMALDIHSDLGNSYQAVLMQDTGWNVQSAITVMTQERAQHISNKMIESENQPANSIENNL
jgi:hypothetical protein